MNTGEIIAELKKHADFESVNHKTAFGCWRTNKKGSPQEVEVCILDAGPTQQLRYTGIAKSEDGKTAIGNPASTISSALFGVHWDELDR